MKNYYEILGISPSSSQQEIKHAYWEMSKRFSVDHLKARKKNASQEEIEEALETCKILNQIYEVLSNYQRKEKYDKTILSEPVIVISQTNIDLGEIGEEKEKKTSFTVDYSGGIIQTFAIDWLDRKPIWGDFKVKDIKFPVKVLVSIKAINGLDEGYHRETIRIQINDKPYDISLQFKFKGKNIEISKTDFNLGRMKPTTSKEFSFKINYPVNDCNISWKGCKPVWGDFKIEANGSSTIVNVIVSCKDYLTDGSHESKLLVTVKNKTQEVKINFESFREPKIEFSDLNIDFGRLE
jgi:curved DNA-binding protein CbpA